MLRRIGLPEVHARFAPWFLKSNQIVLNRWSSVLFARLEQAFYARPEALSTLEVRMREHQAQYDAIMKPHRKMQDGYTSVASQTKALEPREQNQRLLERAFRECSFQDQVQDTSKKKKQQQQKLKTLASIQQDDALAVEKLELIPQVPVVNAPPGLAPQVRGTLESHGKHTFFTYNGRWKDGEMHGPMGVYAFSDGGKYSGEWKQSQQHGSGCTVYPNGVTYRGSFVNGKFHGFGVLEMLNAKDTTGYVYEGEFKAGVRCGMGKLRFLQNDTCYEGEFYDNMRHGKGSETNALGYTYTGLWRQNRMCGPGRLVCSDKMEFFKEQWSMCLLGEAVRMIKRERLGAAEKEESWYRQLLRVRDDLRASDLQYAFWDAEEARLVGEEGARIERLKKARRDKREAQTAAKKAFTEKAQKEETGENGSESENGSGADNDDDEKEESGEGEGEDEEEEEDGDEDDAEEGRHEGEPESKAGE